jgi:hypothetical protein
MFLPPLSATELGIYGTYAHDLGELEVVLTTALACAAHVIFTTAGGKDICIVHASDSVSTREVLLHYYRRHSILIFLQTGLEVPEAWVDEVEEGS